VTSGNPSGGDFVVNCNNLPGPPAPFSAPRSWRWQRVMMGLDDIFGDALANYPKLASHVVVVCHGRGSRRVRVHPYNRTRPTGERRPDPTKGPHFGGGDPRRYARVIAFA